MKNKITFEPSKEKGPEEFKEVRLQIVRPKIGHTWEISYEGDNEGQCASYNRAIEEVCSKIDLGPFFQVGPDNDPGYHAWEMLGGETNEEELQKLFSQIHQRAKGIYEERKKLGFV